VLHKLKDMAIFISKSKPLSLNIAVGTLYFYPNKSYEFRTIGSTTLTEHKLEKLKTQAEEKTKVVGSRDVQVSNKNRISSLLKGEDPNEYAHLSDFLKNQMIGKRKIKDKDTISQNSRCNNAVIEKVSEVLRERKFNPTGSKSRVA